MGARAGRRKDYTIAQMISKRIDRLVEWTKWPAAFAAVATFPFTLFALWNLLQEVPNYPGFATMFLIGVGAFMLLARTSFARSPFARRVVELERDLTQSVLALAMLHPVIGYGENHGKGSRVRWIGRGNWIMLAAPYFVPTATVILWLVSLLVFFQSLRSLILGFGICYHLTAVSIQCRIGTSEIRRLGRKFCWMFLPPMNLLMACCIAAYALNGFTGLGDFLLDWISVPKLVFEWLWDILFTKESIET